MLFILYSYSLCSLSAGTTERVIFLRKQLSKKATAQVLLLLLSAAFLVYGASRGEAGVVLNKAIKLCLECVGIG